MTQMDDLEAENARLKSQLDFALRNWAICLIESKHQELSLHQSAAEEVVKSLTGVHVSTRGQLVDAANTPVLEAARYVRYEKPYLFIEESE